MVSIIPVKGGQYRFAYKCEPAGVSHLGIFHSYAAVEASFAVDLYVEALTPENEIPAHFVGLLGLPELRRDLESTRVGVKVDDIIIIDRIYICKNSIFQSRRVQWRLGMNNLYCISDDEVDEHSSFIGFDVDDEDSYINEENEYHSFKMILIHVRKSFFLSLNIYYFLIFAIKILEL
jgi:hypothetical protein